jgi:hypothetical protein
MIKRLKILFYGTGCIRLAMAALACSLLTPLSAVACMGVNTQDTVITKRGDTYIATTTYQGRRSSHTKCGWQDQNSSTRKITKVDAFGFSINTYDYSLGNYSSTGPCTFNPKISEASLSGPIINLDVNATSSTCQVKFEVIRTFTGTYNGTGDVNNPSNNVVYRPSWNILNTSNNQNIGTIFPTKGINVPNQPTRTCAFTTPANLPISEVKPSDFTGQNSLVGDERFTTQIQCPAIATLFTPKITLNFKEATDAGLTVCAASNIASGDSAAKGVGFRLINVDQSSAAICGSPGATTVANAVFFPKSTGAVYSERRTIGVKYVQTGSSITPGQVSATVIFTANYQ